MLNKFSNLRGKIYKIKILLVFSVLVLVPGARGDEIIKNQVEDLNILISQLIGGQPNVLLLFDGSLSMGDNFGGSQVGSWDVDAVIATKPNPPQAVLGTCESFQSLKGATGANANYAVAHCAGNGAGLNPCGSIACSASQTGTCQTPENFERFLTCIESTYTQGNVESAYGIAVPNACGGGTDPRVACDTDAERARAASAIENLTVQQANQNDPTNFPNLTCGATQCLDTNIADKSCDDPTLFNNFVACMDSSLSSSSCTSGFNCTKPKYGTTRWDAILSTFFAILDADDSLGSLMCDDPNGLYVNPDDPTDPFNNQTVIPCDKFMNTPFRDVGVIAKGTAANSSLPIANGADTKLIDELTPLDASEFNVRIRPTSIGGGGPNDNPPGRLSGTRSCTGNPLSSDPSGGFAGGSIQSFDGIWKFFRDRRVGGRSPVANAIGFDDDNSPSSTNGGDALDLFRIELQTDPACQCRAEFMIVVTGGLDNCSGDCSLPGTSESCSTDASGVPLLVTGFSNMRSSIQATSNIRTYYARNPVTNNTNCPDPLKKEVLTFVIGMGVKGPTAARTLNAMALAGGTHTTGIIRHVDPEGVLVGEVEPLTVLPGAGDQIFRDFGTALGINTNPSAAQLQNCLIPNENGNCTFQGTDVFDNNFFQTAGSPLDSTVLGESFAFFVDDPSELIEALEAIFEFIGNFPTSGVAPTAPTSAASVAVSDRILLANLTPNPPERLWQGRLALYAFVDEPGNPGSKVVIKKPDVGADLTDAAVVDAHRIFNNRGILTANAREFFWDAGKLLTERDISADPRRHLFTVIRTDPSTIDEEIDAATSEVLRLRYEGDKADFNLSNTALDLAQFGISVDDVTGSIPTFCTAAPPDGTADCTADCPVDPLTGNLVTPVSAQCQTCVEDCIRVRTIDFMTGNTKIFPLGDALGSPTTGGQTADSMGYNCPDLADGDTANDDYTHCQDKLGDIFHSAPVLVGSPSPLFFDEGFQPFASQFKDRSAGVYVGANDGFMHAFHGGELVSIPPGGTVTNPFNLEEESIPFFNPGTGVELFGFAPPSFLPDSISENGPESPSGLTPPDYRFGDFKTFVAEKNEERSFMDGSALVADIFVDGYSNGIDDAICSGASSALDGRIDSCGSEWHTLYISGYRNGGGAYTALDVTNVECAGGVSTDCSNIGKHLTNGPDYPTHLWTLFDHDFGNTWSEPTVGRVRMSADDAGTDVTVDRWVMFVGGGMDPLDTDPTNGVTFGDAFYAIDIPTGKIIFKFNPDDPIPSDMTDTDLVEMECDMSARVGVFDLNADGFMDVAYAGDTCGRMWRFDISLPIVADDLSLTGLRGDADITAPGWTGDIAFCATADESRCLDPSTIPVDPVTFVTQRMPIYFAPTAVFDDLGQLHVIFVTGSRRNPTSTLQFGKLYNFIDTYIPAFLAGGSAVTVATKTEASFNAGQIIDIVPLAGVTGQFTTEGGSTVNNQGEFIVRFSENIDSSVDPSVESPMGEKGFGPPVVIARALLFTTFAPDPAQENVCAAGAGEGRLFALDYLSGEPALARVPGAENLLGGDAEQQAATVGKTVAFGMPTPAQLTFGARGSVIMTVAFSGSAAAGGANFLVLELPQLATRTQTLFWEELL